MREIRTSGSTRGQQLAIVIVACCPTLQPRILFPGATQQPNSKIGSVSQNPTNRSTAAES